MGITQVENTCKRLSNPHQLFFSILLQAVFPLLKLLFSIPFFFVIYYVSSIKKHACMHVQYESFVCTIYLKKLLANVVFLIFAVDGRDQNMYL